MIIGKNDYRRGLCRALEPQRARNSEIFGGDEEGGRRNQCIFGREMEMTAERNEMMICKAAVKIWKMREMEKGGDDEDA